MTAQNPSKTAPECPRCGRTTVFVSAQMAASKPVNIFLCSNCVALEVRGEADAPEMRKTG
jgi:transcription elongation factor Elf1